MRVTRDGTVDLYYLDYDEAWDNGGYYVMSSGRTTAASPAHWTSSGHTTRPALCGEGDLDIPMFGLDIDLPMYSSCLDFERGFPLFRVAFSPASFFAGRHRSLPESRTSLLGAVGLSGIGARPALARRSPTPCSPSRRGPALWTQFLRHRAGQEASEVVVFGYAMDHEGYLLTVDDWLLAGYEHDHLVGPPSGSTSWSACSMSSGLRPRR